MSKKTKKFLNAFLPNLNFSNSRHRFCNISGRLLAVVLTLCFVFALGGCGIGANNDTAQNTDGQTYGVGKYVDAVSYDMNLTLDTQQHRLKEAVSVAFENKTDQPVSELYLRNMASTAVKFAQENFTDTNKDKNCTLISITLSDGTPLQYQYGDNESIIRVNLGEANAIPAGGAGEITINMETDIPDRSDRFGYRITDQGTMYMLSFCFPYLADNVNGQWNLDPFFDDGESRSTDLAGYNVTFTAPAKYIIAATGAESTAISTPLETNANDANDNAVGITTITAQSVRDFALVACDFMKLDSFTASGITINSYYLDGKFTEEYRQIAKAVAIDSIDIFTQKLGPYAYEELDIVPALFGFAYGGMEYPELIMVNASSFYDTQFYDAWTMEGKIAHEIAHQWFYAVVGNNEYREGWLDEGFTTLMESDIYGLAQCDAHEAVDKLEEYYPSYETRLKSREELIASAREDYKNIYLNVAPANYPKDQEYGTAEYSGGYIFLQEVRLQLGDEAFMDFIKEYYETFYMKIARTEDVLNLIRAYDNSTEMNEIIKFYFK